jgi:hypothetical protein
MDMKLNPLIIRNFLRLINLWRKNNFSQFQEV